MKIKYPEEKEKLLTLHAGDMIEYTGVLYTSRDAAHMRLAEMVEKKEEIPVDYSSQFIYYAGPTPTKPGHTIGSIGPTTSSRMDKFAPLMSVLHVRGTIGKGPRSKECSQYYKDHHILYFVATGGCGALLSHCVKKAEEVAFLDLGPESVKRLEVEDFPLLLAIDAFGEDLFEKE